MNRKLIQKLKQNKAFTLMEMMITLTLIIILLGISVIGITDWSKKIKMTELDNHAKSVYLEAQNQLAAMEAEGSLPKLYNKFAKDGGEYNEEYGSRRLENTPADYNVELYGDFYKGIYYFINTNVATDSVTTLFVPEISSADEYGNYLIEVNLETGDVYGVFYWENDNEYLASQTKAENMYALIKGMEAKGDTNNRSVESRSEYMIGYYGGNGGDTLATSPYKLDQEVKIVNGEELYIEISYNLNDVTMGQVGQVTNQFDIEITIKGETSGAEWIHTHVLDHNFVEDNPNGRLITGFLLDGTSAGHSFADIIAAAPVEEFVDGKKLIPGENLEISVKTIYQHGGIRLKEQSSVYRTNSLFHDVTDRTVVNGASEKLERTIGVSSVRHLRNLNETYYAGDIATIVNEKTINSYVIVQKNDINALNGSYAFVTEDEKINYKQPVIRETGSLSPIENRVIFWKGDKEVTVNGNDFTIKNLKVASNVKWADVDKSASDLDDDNKNGATAVGLFKRTNNVHFINVKLEDYTVTAPAESTYTGGIVGLAIGGTIEKSGVYLAPSYRDENGEKQYYNQEKDTSYGTVMGRHYATMKVSGGYVVGGLAGKISETYITDSYVAVQVTGNNTVGGLVGEAVGKVSASQDMTKIDTQAEVDELATIINSYASGDVYAIENASDRESGKTAGGFVALGENLVMYNCYATGDVRATTIMAGFIGNTQHCYAKNSNSYGKVLKKDGSDQFVAGEAVVGGFFATGADSHADVATSGYLSQLGYNAAECFTDATSMRKEYKDLATTGTESKASSAHPYDPNLLFKAFPFKMVTEHHYGDWPVQYFINTSLVYYEKYADGSYGYYSVTKLTDNAASNAQANDYVWVLDSLHDDKECKEDGYALLSMFYLDTVDYTIYQYADKTNDNRDNPKWVAQEKNGKTVNTLTVTEDEYGSDKLVRLDMFGGLEFDAYEKVDNPYNANYDGQQPKSSFITNGMYLYQLPYDLQNTYRYDVDNFYDVIVFNEGYAVGNTKGEDGEVGGTPVISNEVYYYCPHFPRLAVNPGLGVSASTTDFVELEAPDTVAIRTARHLNNLGRVPYYWNDKGGGTDLITYSQELDINFSTYARWNDSSQNMKYCGEVYNLLAFDQPYSNEPIGQNAQLSDGYGAFQNDYNGNYHKIIDYCVKSKNQYVGLFGEIYKDGGATHAQISNVVMMVSEANKGNQGNYLTADVKKQNNAGLIISNYQEKSNASGNNRQRTGIGALVGSDYTVGVTDGDAEVFTIYNCASAGYQVQYHIEPTTSGYQQPLGIAIGGMIGYSRGNVAQSTATNDVKIVARASITGDEAAVMMGGFTGSAFFGTTLNCYAGGTIDVDDNNGTCYINRLRIGGFCPGWMYAKGVENESNEEDVRYQNIYSYTAVQERVWSVREAAKSSNVFSHLIPTVSRMRLYYEYRLGDGTKWHTDYENGSNAVRVPGFSYYLNTVITETQLDRNGSDATRYYEYVKPSITHWSDNRPKTCDPASYENLSNKNWVNSNKSFGNTVAFNTTKWYESLVYMDDTGYSNYAVPISSALKTEKYSFPLFVRDANGQFVHYGDWPLNK